jgi:hypothetical protein
MGILADPGSLTGWLLEATSTKMPASIAKSLELGFSRLMNNVPNPGEASHKEAMEEMVAEIVNSNTLMTYLTEL